MVDKERGVMMSKIKKVVIPILVVMFLLSACGGKKYLSYQESYKKLEEAGYTITGHTEKEKILIFLQELAEDYNEYVVYENSEYDRNLTKMDANTTNVESMIYAYKGELKVFIFYCEDEDSAVMVSRAIDSLFSSEMGEIMASQDKNFAYLYSAEVNDVLGFRD